MDSKPKINVNFGGGGSAGFSVASLLGIVFIVLKLCGVISWSWLWVLAPFWIAAGLSILIIIVVLVIYAIVHIKS